MCCAPVSTAVRHQGGHVHLGHAQGTGIDAHVAVRGERLLPPAALAGPTWPLCAGSGRRSL
eukprot:6685202-Alexandrium_andersonii.AAC.1